MTDPFSHFIDTLRAALDNGKGKSISEPKNFM
jgi:hypothetical protein